MKRLVFSFIAAGVLVLSTAAGSRAQSEEEFIGAFAGDWESFDQSLSSGEGKCAVTLAPDKEEQAYALSMRDCGGAMSDVAAWGIVDNQLALLDDEGSILVRLGGNQNRITGETNDGRAVIFERAGTAVSAVSPQGISNGACLYVGYTASCAEADDIAPIAASSASDEKSAAVLVNLNARKEARPDAQVVSVIPKNTCVAVSQCTEASDGRWCEAKLQKTTAWIRQQVVRDSKWQVLAYRGGC